MANWDDRHCRPCHDDPADEGCVVCHEGTNGKAELHQDYWPSFHDGFVNNQTDCFMGSSCHN
jgi:hypothetical protein